MTTASIDFEVVKNLCALAAENADFADEATLDMTTNRTFEGAAETAELEKEGENSGEAPVLVEPPIAFQRSGFVVVRPDALFTEQTKEHLEKFGAMPTLPYATQLKTPSTKHKEEEDEEEAVPEFDLNPLHVNVTALATPGAVAVDAAAFRVLNVIALRKPDSNRTGLAPALGYFLEETAPTADTAPFRLIPSQPNIPVGIVAATACTIRVPVIPMAVGPRGEDDDELEEGEFDWSGKTPITFMESAIYEASRTRFRVPATPEDGPEFRLPKEMADAFLAYERDEAEIFAVFELTPGMMMVTTRAMPFQILATSGRAVVKVVVACRDEHHRLNAEGEPEEQVTVNRPLDVVTMLTKGACRAGRFGVKYPVHPGSCQPDASPCLPDDQCMWGVPGPDNILRRVPLREDGVEWPPRESCSQMPICFFVMPQRELNTRDYRTPPTKVLAKKMLSYWSLAAMCAVHDELVARNREIIVHGAPGIAKSKMTALKSARQTQEAAASKWGKVVMTTFTTKLTAVMGTDLPRAEAVLTDRREALALLREAVPELQRAEALVAEHSIEQSRITDLLTNNRETKLPDLRKSPTVAKVKAFSDTLKTAHKWIKAYIKAAEQASAKRGSSKAAAAPEIDMDSLPDPESYRPDPHLIQDIGECARCVKDVKDWRNAKKKNLEEIMAQETAVGGKVDNPYPDPVGCMNLLKGELVSQWTALKRMVTTSPPDASEISEPFDRAPIDWIVRRVEAWPKHPFVYEAEEQRKRARAAAAKTMPDECPRCGNEDFIKETVRVALGVASRCLKCESRAIYHQLEAQHRRVQVAFNEQLVEDVPRIATEPTAKADEAEYEALRARCKTKEELDECEADIEDEIAQRAMARVERHELMLQDAMEQAAVHLDEIDEKAATKRKHQAPQSWEKFVKATRLWRGLMSCIDISEIPEQDGDGDSHGSEKLVEIADACAECGGGVFGGRCADCGADADAEYQPMEEEDDDDADEEEDDEAPAPRRRRKEEKKGKRLKRKADSIETDDMSPAELVALAASRMTGADADGPTRHNLTAMAAAMASRQLSNLSTVYAPFITSVLTVDPYSGMESWDYSTGSRLGDVVFATEGAAKKHLEERYSYEDGRTNYLYVAPIIHTKKARVDQESAALPPTAAPKRGRKDMDEDDDDEEASGSDESRVKVHD